MASSCASIQINIVLSLPKLSWYHTQDVNRENHIAPGEKFYDHYFFEQNILFRVSFFNVLKSLVVLIKNIV